jgi:hypothetical protein
MGSPTITPVTCAQMDAIPVGTPFTAISTTSVGTTTDTTLVTTLAQQYEGKVIKCSTRASIYKVVNGKKRLYPDMDTYVAAGSPAWVPLTCAQVDSIPSGNPFPSVVSTATGTTLAQQYEGKNIKCDAQQAIYKIENGKKRLYPNWSTYVAAGTPVWVSLTCAQVDSIPTGAVLPSA